MKPQRTLISGTDERSSIHKKERQDKNHEEVGSGAGWELREDGRGWSAATGFSQR